MEVQISFSYSKYHLCWCLKQGTQKSLIRALEQWQAVPSQLRRAGMAGCGGACGSESRSIALTWDALSHTKESFLMEVWKHKSLKVFPLHHHFWSFTRFNNAYEVQRSLWKLKCTQILFTYGRIFTSIGLFLGLFSLFIVLQSEGKTIRQVWNWLTCWTYASGVGETEVPIFSVHNNADFIY